MIKVKIKKINPEVKIPNYAHKGDAGLDLYALETQTIRPGEHGRFWNGFALEIPEGYVGIIKDKGSISKAELHTMGGVFDSGYRGEYNVHLVNLGKNPYTIEKGQKVAQLIILPVAEAHFEEVKELSDTSRGEGRFGSTGKS